MKTENEFPIANLVNNHRFGMCCPIVLWIEGSSIKINLTLSSRCSWLANVRGSGHSERFDELLLISKLEYQQPVAKWAVMKEAASPNWPGEEEVGEKAGWRI